MIKMTIPEHIQNQKLENLKRFPSLAIGLTQEQIEQATYGEKISKLSDHQRLACQLLAIEINFHPMYTTEICPQARPPLLCEYGSEKQWAIHCALWEIEHNASTEDLVKIYKIEFARIADRLLEPLDRHSSGVLMSSHDNTTERYPCDLADW